MEKKHRLQRNILEITLERLIKLYEEDAVCPGRLIRLGIKPRGNTVLGSNSECGMAANTTGLPGTYRDRAENSKFLDLVGKPLFEIADRGIHATNLQECCIECTLPAVSWIFIHKEPGISCTVLDAGGINLSTST